MVKKELLLSFVSALWCPLYLVRTILTFVSLGRVNPNRALSLVNGIEPSLRISPSLVPDGRVKVVIHPSFSTLAEGALPSEEYPKNKQRHPW